jgi:hypothetical protein
LLMNPEILILISKSMLFWVKFPLH